MNIAVFGGTFDPVHLGHLIIAEQAYNSFNLDKVIFMPAGNPPHKSDINITSEQHRLNMLKLAVKDNSHFEISEWELSQDSKSYTVDTLKYMKSKFPEQNIYFIIGADSLYEIFEWKQPEYILENANLIVALRPEYSIDNIFNDQRYNPYRGNIDLLDNCLIDISSTKIRKLAASGKSIRYLTLEKVIEYIENNELY